MLRSMPQFEAAVRSRLRASLGFPRAEKFQVAEVH